MPEIISEFLINHGVERVILLSLLGLLLLAFSVIYRLKPEKYYLHLIYVLALATIVYPAYNYSIDYITMNSAIVNVDPSQREALVNQINSLMRWHIWYPAVFIIPSLILVVSVKLLNNNKYTVD